MSFTSKDNLWTELDKLVASKSFVELHSHLLGMGSADFWLRVMFVYLPRVVTVIPSQASFSEAMMPLLCLAFPSNPVSYCKSLLDGLLEELDTVTRLPAAKKLKTTSGASSESSTKATQISVAPDVVQALKASRTDVTQFLREHFTDDVVFSEDNLAKICGVDEKLSTEMRRYQLEGLLHNRDGGSESSVVLLRKYVYFNVRKRELCCAVGVRNGDLVRLMESPHSSVKALVRNWFQFLGHDGHAPDFHDIVHIFRGNFSPAFYPMRFTAKDCIYEQRPEVLGILLNTVLSRYDLAGVGYVELSIGANDVQYLQIFHALNEFAFNTPLVSITKKQRRQPQPQPHDGEEQVVAETEDSEEENYAGETGTSTAPAFKSKEKKVRSGLKRDLKPKWRSQFCVYNVKPKQLHVNFLAAFNRNDVRLPFFERPASKIEDLLFGTLMNSSTFKDISLDSRLCWTDKKKNEKVPVILDDNNVPVDNAVKAMMLLVDRLHKDVSLEDLAQHLCADDQLVKMFPNQIQQAKEMLVVLNNHATHPELLKYWEAFLVGLDVVGDEMGYPYSPLSHKSFVEVVEWFHNNGRPSFGVRVHAGESVPRPPSSAFATSSATSSSSPLQRVFELHMRVLMCSINKLYLRVRCNNRPCVRIGHGVAFLHEPGPSMSDLAGALSLFRKDCIDRDIVFELNPTSNHMLLFDSYADTNTAPKNLRTLKRFLDLGLHVTLCTDDDGIWAIHKCTNHYSHISVAHEYCDAIVFGEITTVAELHGLVNNGRKAVFTEMPTMLGDNLA